VCGICGLASLDGITPVDAGKLAEMNATLEHRGPDSSGSFSDGPVGLAAAASRSSTSPAATNRSPTRTAG